ncbi:MAG: hypothetical protein ACRBCJ_01695 [Hyphomicrobiaceae bacterium]
MNKGLAYGILCAFIAASIALIAARPEWVDDSNRFFREFVNHEFINVLGVILAITLASAAQIHLAFNRIEERYKVRNALEKTRGELRNNAYWLIGLFLFGVVIVVTKPVVCSGPTGQAFFNLTALLVLVWHVLILVSLTQLVFSIESEFPDDRDSGA